jgi:hypothetical protein
MSHRGLWNQELEHINQWTSTIWICDLWLNTSDTIISYGIDKGNITMLK